MLLRPFYRRAEEYQLLVTFGLLQILEDLMRLIWGGTPLSADTLMDALPILRIGGLIYPAYNLVVIGIGIVAAVVLWAAIYHTKFGVMLRATSQDRRMASALGLNVGMVYVVAFGIGCFMAGLGGAIVVPTQAACSAWVSMRWSSPSSWWLSAASGVCKGALVRRAGRQLRAHRRHPVLPGSLSSPCSISSPPGCSWSPTGLFGTA